MKLGCHRSAEAEAACDEGKPDPLLCCSMPERGSCRPTADDSRGSGASLTEQLQSRSNVAEQLAYAAGHEDEPVGCDEDCILNPCKPDDAEVDQSHVKSVPGSSASSIRIWECWREWHHQIFAADTAFSIFYKAQCRSRPATSRGVAHSGPWPMPLPFHGFLADHSVSSSEKGFRLLLNMQISYMNFITLGERGKPPDDVCGPAKLTPQQWDIVARFKRLSSMWREQPELHAAAMGRTAAKQERQEEMIAELSRLAISAVSELKKYQSLMRRRSQHVSVASQDFDDDNPRLIGKTRKADVCAAQSIIASRIKMEGKPNYDPTPFLDDEAGKLFAEPFHQGWVDRKDELCPPTVRVHACLAEKMSLLQLLEDTGRLQFRAPSEIHLGFGNGLFSVPKIWKLID